MPRVFVQLLTLALLAGVLPARADVRVEHTSDVPLIDGEIHIEGVIEAGDAEKLRRALNYESDLWRQIFLASPGGDLAEAMQMGRLLRQADATLFVGRDDLCASSCTFILMGGNRRQINGSVAIHRPYLAETIRDDDVDDVYKNTVSAVGDYLAEMNIPAGLTDLMFSIPPSDIRVLSRNEVELYFPYEAPVAEARRINAQAAEIGISSAMYRSRQAYAKSHCEEFDFYCHSAIAWGVSKQVYEAWHDECWKWVTSRPENQGRKGYVLDCNGIDDPVGSPLDWLQQ